MCTHMSAWTSENRSLSCASKFSNNSPQHVILRIFIYGHKFSPVEMFENSDFWRGTFFKMEETSGVFFIYRNTFLYLNNRPKVCTNKRFLTVRELLMALVQFQTFNVLYNVVFGTSVVSCLTLRNINQPIALTVSSQKVYQCGNRWKRPVKKTGSDERRKTRRRWQRFCCSVLDLEVGNGPLPRSEKLAERGATLALAEQMIWWHWSSKSIWLGRPRGQTHREKKWGPRAVCFDFPLPKRRWGRVGLRCFLSLPCLSPLQEDMMKMTWMNSGKNRPDSNGLDMNARNDGRVVSESNEW